MIPPTANDDQAAARSSRSPEPVSGRSRRYTEGEAMSPQGRRLVSGLVSSLIVIGGWERPVLSQPLVAKIADLPAIINGVQGSLLEGPNNVLYGTSASGRIFSI